MGREEEIINERKRKIEELKKSGVNPYAHRFNQFEQKSFSVDVQQKYSDLKAEEISKKEEIVAGRVMFLRSFGKLAFAKLQDVKGNIQIVFQSEKTPEKIMDFFNKYIDSGDIVGAKGNPMKTKTGEVSILVKEFDLLTKSVLPLPDKVHGLKDEEERLRKRYLDVIMNSDVKEMFIKKQKFWSTVRNFLIEKGFLEVETPILENSAGGAAATPFATHHNALDLDVYLRISMGELWQKKLLVAGYEKTFEIGRQFRNEGMDAEHLQDYTQMEFYWGYANFEDGMKLVEEMYKKLTMATLGKLDFEYKEYKIDLGKKWERYDYEKLIEEKTKINIYKADKKDIIKFLEKEKIEFDQNVDKWRLVDILWKYCRKQLSGPGFLVGQPVELTPLAKRSEKDPRKVEQFQVILAGSEMGNGYSELNDPLDQESRFEEQRKNKEAGDSEAMDHDETFIEALKYGMPPACGFGFSERLFAIMMNKPIRETVIFPLMKPSNYVELIKSKDEAESGHPLEKKSEKPKENSQKKKK
ncbi:Aspartate--tRNA(Asp/Asn) ligase [uncultured archaeon]|nr:Aspartate--tRNA(Asp/Asn) ligase [uncultured archaeon]